MKIQKLFLSILAAASLFAGCKEPEPEPTIPFLSVGQTELSFEQNGGTGNITITSNRPWSISTDADWLAFNPSSGNAADAPVTVTVTALANSSTDRTASFKVKTDFDFRTVEVSQKGAKGEDPNTTPTGKGTADDPYNVVAAINAVANLTWTSNDDYQSTDVVYVKGKISSIADKGTFTDAGTYGNASFHISTDGTSVNDLYAYRILYLGNKRFKTGQTDIKVGDEVVICGKLMNYKGNTPETASGAYLYSLNGETGGGQGSESEPKGTGTLEDPYNPAGAAAAVANLKWTSNEDYQTTEDVYMKGKICRIADNGTFSESGTFGNATFFISEDGEGDGEFYVYRTLYLGNKKFESGQTDIKVGDEVIIHGKLMNYRGNTPETVASKTYVYSLNGVTGGDTPGPGPSGDPKGTGTLEDPYNPAGAAAAVKDLTWTSNEDYQSTGDVYVMGKICKIANNGTFTEGGTYGNASFYISEDGEGDGEFYVFRTLYLGNKKFESGQTDIKVGDEVIIHGKLMNYRGNTPETVSGKTYLYSLNGVTGGDEPGPGGDEEVKVVTVAEFIAAEDSKTQPYKLTGKVSNIKNETYGNFDLTDDSGTIYVYGLVSKDLGGYTPNKANDKSFASIGIKEGDEITIIGYRETFTKDDVSTNEVVGAYYVSGASGTGGDVPGPGGESEDLKTATIAEFLAAVDSKTQPYKLTGKVSNIANNTYGNFDLTDATGTVYVYGLVAKDLGGYGPNKANDKSFASIGIKEGDEITIIGYRETFTNDSGSKNEVVGAYYVSGASGSGETPGGDTPGGDVSGNTETIDFSQKGYANGEAVSSFKGTNVTITFDKGTNSNAPKYYTSGTAIRCYGSNSLTISSSKTITAIKFTYGSSDGTNDITVDKGTFTKDSWTGSATSVKFTIGGTTGHRRIKVIAVTFAE